MYCYINVKYFLLYLFVFLSDDPEGITVNAAPDRDARPNVLDMVWTRHRSSSPKEKAARKVAKKVLTSEMVNGGIKVILKLTTVLHYIPLCLQVMSYAVRGPLAIRAVALEKEIKEVLIFFNFFRYHMYCCF